MLAVSPLRNANDGSTNNQGEMESFSIGAGVGCNSDFPDFSDGSLLDSIDFDDLFVGIDDGDVLPDLEMDPELLAEFSASCGEESGTGCSSISVEKAEAEADNGSKREADEDKASELDNISSGSRGEEIVSKRDESVVVNPFLNRNKETDKGKRSSAQSSKSNPQAHGKRKVKVDWTPELHRRFVQAVEQLGVDKAVPSRILELMGIDCLTRHNIASHLQKYRSHRKHMLAREAEAASWSQRRHMYGNGGHKMRPDTMMMVSHPMAATAAPNASPWLAPPPTLGFPPVTPMHPHFRPLHVWGHPSADQSLMPVWPKHSPSTLPPPSAWAAPPHGAAPSETPFWHPHGGHQRVLNTPTPGTPCFAQRTLPTTRFGAPPVPGIPPHAMYKVDRNNNSDNNNNWGYGVSTGPSASHPPFDFHPVYAFDEHSKETIDAAIGDVLSKPWLPLPLGLKPPSMDSVLGELQRQGVPKIPPCA